MGSLQEDRRVEDIIQYFEGGGVNLHKKSTSQHRVKNIPHTGKVSKDAYPELHYEKVSPADVLAEAKRKLTRVENIHNVPKTKSETRLLEDFLQRKATERTGKGKSLSTMKVKLNEAKKIRGTATKSLHDQRRNRDAMENDRTKGEVTDLRLRNIGNISTSKDGSKTSSNEAKTIKNKVNQSINEITEFRSGSNIVEETSESSEKAFTEDTAENYRPMEEHFQRDVSQGENMFRNDFVSKPKSFNVKQKEADYVHSKEYQAIIEDFVHEFGFKNEKMDAYYDRETEKLNLFKPKDIYTNTSDVSLEKSQQKPFITTKELDVKGHREDIENTSSLQGSQQFKKADANSHFLGKQSYKRDNREEPKSPEAMRSNLKTQQSHGDLNNHSNPLNKETFEKELDIDKRLSTTYQQQQQNIILKDLIYEKGAFDNFVDKVTNISPCRSYNKVSPRRSSLSPTAKVPETISEEVDDMIIQTKAELSKESKQKRQNIEDVLKRASNLRSNASSVAGRRPGLMRHSLSAPLLRLNGRPINVALNGELREKSPMNERSHMNRRGSEPTVERLKYRARSKSDSFLEMNSNNSENELLDEVLHVKHSVLKTHQDFLILKLKVECIKRDLSELRIQRARNT